ncbi:MAG TPA: hypothetical protein VJ874_03665 [Candidatus Thermoplasmatota archaeon]|nr:hypothetical protein [Candidatus Thermoplasmatota archaeon]
MHAEIVQMRLYDLGAEVDLGAVRRLHGRQPTPAPVIAQSSVPSSAKFPQPYEVSFDAEGAPAGTRIELRVHRLGVLAVRIRWPCSIDSMVALADEPSRIRIEGLDPEAYSLQLFQQTRAELQPHLCDPYAATVPEERYLVYCVLATPELVPKLLLNEARAIAQLISDSPRQELVPARIAAASKHTLQNTPGDAIVIGWEHAVILDEPGQYEDILDVMELANLELLEFRTYDSHLDLRLDASFDALDRLWAGGGLFRSARSALQDISRLRVEFARLTDSLHDTGKIFGDWYTAQLHRHLLERFHVASWERAVTAKMATLEDMFHLAQEEATHRRSLLLEGMIVLLFILDLVLLFQVR